MGLMGNLQSFEILEQLAWANREAGFIRNVVFMGAFPLQRHGIATGKSHFGTHSIGLVSKERLKVQTTTCI